METAHNNKSGSLKQLWHFILHLRWHYQLFILSGGFLLGGVLSTDLRIQPYLVQFFNVHLLLFGGATAYNSYWDKDTEAIGGLKNPPKMDHWMWLASLLLQMIGLLLAVPLGGLYVTVYAFSMLLFWVYSTPLIRWKGRPIKSLIAIGVSTGLNSVLLGFIAAGNQGITVRILVAAIGVMLILLSLYPTSQIYQQEEDSRRGDQTFAIQYGIPSVIRFFEICYASGLILLSGVLLTSHFAIGLLFGIVGAVVGFWVRSVVRGLTAQKDEYRKVMRVKYITSLCFVLFLIMILIVKHLPISGISGTVDLLLR